MDENNLVTSFEKFLDTDISQIAKDAVEAGKDLCMEDEVLNNIPFIGAAFKMYKIGNKIHDSHCLRKLYSYILAFNSGNCPKDVKDKRYKKFSENEVFRKQELEYLLILIDRYIGLEKPQMLAKIYLAYLDDKINWVELTQYAEVVDRFLPGDKEFLLKHKECYHKVSIPIPDAFLRLVALGIYEEYIPDISVPTTLGTILIPERKDKTFKTTDFGVKLQDILGNEDTSMYIKS